jgi:hypothetical protein
VMEDLMGLRQVLIELMPVTGTIPRTTLMRQSAHLAPRWARLMALEYAVLCSSVRLSPDEQTVERWSWSKS